MKPGILFGALLISVNLALAQFPPLNPDGNIPLDRTDWQLQSAAAMTQGWNVPAADVLPQSDIPHTFANS
jgi:hypothetical protein